MSGEPKSVAETLRTRPPITIEQVTETILLTLYRALDEGPHAQRGGHS